MNKYRPERATLLILTALFLLGACSADRRPDGSAVQDEMAAREPKKVTESEILELASRAGAEIAAQAKTTISGNLMAALIEGGLEYAIGFCNLKANPIVDSLQAKYGARIRRVTMKVRNPQDAPDETEGPILEAYAAASADSLPLGDHVQLHGDDEVLFTRPIVIDNALCLSCHGLPGQELAEETRNLIKKYYPDDQATGYRMGELRGMWSIRMQKSALIKSL
jgi:hypothetical protein